MDVVKAVKTYIDKIIAEPAAMKVLLLDAETTPIVSLVSTQSSLLAQQVYLTDRIDSKKRDRLPHMKCVSFLRPSPDSLDALADELRDPRYGEYYLYFSNVLSRVSIERLAEADEYEVVREVQECFGDYAPVLPSLFSINHHPTPDRPLFGSSINVWNPDALERTVQGLIGVLLSLKKKPIIRYEKMSSMAKKLGQAVQQRIGEEASLFDFRSSQTPPLLLILDRRNDPVTPLLSQWTYQAMVHELLCIQNGRVNLSLVPDIRPELKEITLSVQTDEFFAQNHLATFGELGSTLKDYVQSYQSRSKQHQPTSINSISDMKKFIEEYPEVQKLGGNVSKHVALVGELSRLVGRDLLLEVGECEQGLGTAEGADIKVVQGLLANNSVSAANKLRLVMLYALRYQKQAQSSNIEPLVRTLLEQGLTRDDARLVYAILNIAGAEQRQDDLFSTESIFSKGRNVLKGLKGVENVYTQHTPHLSQTLEHLLKGRLRDASYPFLEGEGAGVNAGLQRPQDIIIFMIGGTTYEESRHVELLNHELLSTTGNTHGPTGTRVLLGGTCIHNSASFLDFLAISAKSFGPDIFAPPAENPSKGATPGLNLQLGNLSVSVGGSAGTGLYRSSGDGGASVQAEGIEGIRDGVKNLMGKVKLGLGS